MEPRFLTGEPALLAGKKLVVADLHIGVEHSFYRAGVKVPSQLASIIERIDSLLDSTGARSLVILGDLKHKVPGITWQELREIPVFMKHFSERVRIELVPGNHDADVAKVLMKSDYNLFVHPSSGVSADGFFLCHGHSWPDREFLKSEFLVMGHSHPMVEFQSELGHRWTEPVWVRAELDRKKIEKKYGKMKKIPELIIMPAFNRFAGGMALNRPEREREWLGPIARCARMDRALLYLLDGTFLGELDKIKRPGSG